MSGSELIGRLLEREAVLEDRLEAAEVQLSLLRREARAMRDVIAGRETAVMEWLAAMEKVNRAGVLASPSEGRLK